MDSGSDEEFYDASEEMLMNRPVSTAHNKVETLDLAKGETNETQSTQDVSEELKQELFRTCLEAERDKMINKDNVILLLQSEKHKELPKGHASNTTIKGEHVIDANKNDTETEDIVINKPVDTKTDLSIIHSKCSETTDSPPPPVAPPRRKRKQKKEHTPVDVVDEGDQMTTVENKLADVSIKNASNPVIVLPDIVPANNDDNILYGEFATTPCIKVSGNPSGMKKVLETGNSLEVVFNDDLLARKSGGVSPTVSLKTTSNSRDQNSSSGCTLTDEEILDSVKIKNLDTGESIPLSQADEIMPQCTNPLALHILKIATENESNNIVLHKEEEDGNLSDTASIASGKLQAKRKKLKKFLGKTVQKIRSVADEVTGQGRRDESSSDEEEQQHSDDGGYIRFKNHRAIKDKLLFNRIKLLQDLSGEHIGAIWTMKFSLCGKLLATAGQDNIVRVWVLKESASNFEEMRLKYSRQPTGRSSPTGSMTSHTSVNSTVDDDPLIEDLLLVRGVDEDKSIGPFKKSPFVSYHGHTSDVLDLSWSKNYFLLSSSMDKTVRLWHISRQECLCCFQHVDFVTAICFHPRDDRYFLSGSLDGKIRLWNIPEKKVALWNEIDGSGTSLVTAANFCQNGKLAVVGTYDGRCIFYDTERLKYHTQVTVRSSRGKNSRGRKISGIEPMPGEDKVLITSNDSRVRLYDLKDHSLYCKYKGLQNESSQIKASFSHDGKMILCGSEDKFVYIWRTNHDVPNVRTDRNEYYESFSAHDAVVTAAIFAPYPTVIVDTPPQENAESSISTSKDKHNPFEILVAADWEGGVKLYVNR